MRRTGLTATWHTLIAALRQLLDRLTRRGRRPPLAGVREPRRPRPTLPAAAVALAEPRVRRRIRLTRRRGDEHLGG